MAPGRLEEPSARPGDLFGAGYWVDLARLAEQSRLDFLTIEGLADRAAGQAGGRGRTDRVQGRLDAVLVAARVAPLTSGIGLVPSVTVTHTEPFHVSKAIATLDYVSSGRAGVRVQVSARSDEAGHFGRRTFPAVGLNVDPADVDPAARTLLVEDLMAEAADYVEVLRRLWDSWEDDAEEYAMSARAGSSTGPSCITSSSPVDGSRSRGRRSRPAPHRVSLR